jgi:hypothetical protein
MIFANERLIIVLGMAHSGTTILTYVLRQHPHLLCCVDGDEAWILENTWLPLEQSASIERTLTNRPTKRILLKRPWSCVNHGEWMAREMPNAKYIYCYRDFEDISASWSRPNSFVEVALQNGGVEYQREHYRMCLERAESFARGVPFFKKVDHRHFVENPSIVITDIAAWAGLEPFRFDVRQF